MLTKQGRTLSLHDDQRSLSLYLLIAGIVEALISSTILWVSGGHKIAWIVGCLGCLFALSLLYFGARLRYVLDRQLELMVGFFKVCAAAWFAYGLFAAFSYGELVFKCYHLAIVVVGLLTTRYLIRTARKLAAEQVSLAASTEEAADSAAA